MGDAIDITPYATNAGASVIARLNVFVNSAFEADAARLLEAHPRLLRPWATAALAMAAAAHRERSDVAAAAHIEARLGLLTRCRDAGVASVLRELSAATQPVPDALDRLRRDAESAGDEYETTNGPAALEAWLAALARVLEHPQFASSPRHYRRGAWTHFANAAMARFLEGGPASDGTAALDALEAVLGLADEGARVTPSDLGGYAAAAAAISRVSGDSAAISRAVARILDSPGLTAVGASHPGALGTLYLSRAELNRSREDLDAAVRALTEAIEQSSDDDRAEYCAQLGSAYFLRHEWLTSVVDLDDAIDALRRAIALDRGDGDASDGWRTRLAEGLNDRYSTTEEVTDLDEAIALVRNVGETYREQHPEAVIHLGAYLRRRYERLGDIRDLDRAVGLYDAMLASAGTEPYVRGFVMNNLGVALLARSEERLAGSDLERATELLATAAADPAQDVDRRWERMHNLASARVAACLRWPTARNAEQALEVIRTTFDMSPDSRRPSLLAQSTIAASVRARASGESAHRRAAIATGEQALGRLPHDDNLRARLIDELGRTLLDDWTHTREEAQLHRAVEIFELGLFGRPELWPHFPAQVGGLAESLRLRHGAGGDAADAERATDAYRIASQHPHLGDLDARLSSACAWAGWAADRGAEGELRESLDCCLERALEIARVAVASDEAGAIADRRRDTVRETLERVRAAAPGAAAQLLRAQAALGDDARAAARQLLERLADGEPAAAARYRDAAAEAVMLLRSSLTRPPQRFSAQRDEQPALLASLRLEAALRGLRADPRAARDAVLGATSPDGDHAALQQSV